MKNKYNKFNPVPYEAHMLVYNMIREKSRVLDVGCATGYFAEKLRQKKCHVYGIEIDPCAAKISKSTCEEVITTDIEEAQSLGFKRQSFDYILLLDMLEHLKNPLRVLNMLSGYLKPDGDIIISVPNIAHISIRLKLLFGKFDYENQGIMDKSHLKFLTKSSVIKLIETANLKMDDIDYSSDFGRLPVLGRIARYIPKRFQYFFTRQFNTLLSVQFILVCKSKK